MVRLKDIPEYLHSSELYKSLQEGCDDFDVPSGHLKQDQSVCSEKDARELLNTLRYWGVEGTVDPVVMYLTRECKDPEEGERLVAEFGIEFPYLEAFSQMIELTSFQGRLNVAVAAGSILAIEYLREMDKRESGEDVLPKLTQCYMNTFCAIAASNNRIECLKYLLDNYPKPKVPFRRPGHVSVLFHTDEKGHVWSRRVCAAAAAGGHIECLRFLREQRFQWHETACSAAAGTGKLECLQYLHDTGCPWNKDTCTAAAAGDHLPCLQYAHEHGCPLGDSCTSAAGEGSLACLRYLHEQGAEWDEYTTRNAAKFGHKECLRYAMDHNCPYEGMPQVQSVPKQEGRWRRWFTDLFRTKAARVYPRRERVSQNRERSYEGEGAGAGSDSEDSEF